MRMRKNHLYYSPILPLNNRWLKVVMWSSVITKEKLTWHRQIQALMPMWQAERWKVTKQTKSNINKMVVFYKRTSFSFNCSIDLVVCNMYDGCVSDCVKRSHVDLSKVHKEPLYWAMRCCLELAKCRIRYINIFHRIPKAFVLSVYGVYVRLKKFSFWSHDLITTTSMQRAISEHVRHTDCSIYIHDENVVFVLTLLQF